MSSPFLQPDQIRLISFVIYITAEILLGAVIIRMLVLFRTGRWLRLKRNLFISVIAIFLLAILPLLVRFNMLKGVEIDPLVTAYAGLCSVVILLVFAATQFARYFRKADFYNDQREEEQK